MSIVIAEARAELRVIKRNGLFAMLAAAATEHQVPVALILGVGSRETNLRNMRGDFRGGRFHGYGILQADIQHPEVQQVAQNGAWASRPELLIDFCVGLLAADLKWAHGVLGNAEGDDVQRLACAAYNAGQANALKGHQAGNADKLTTGGDYGRDCTERANVFAKLLVGA